MRGCRNFWDFFRMLNLQVAAISEQICVHYWTQVKESWKMMSRPTFDYFLIRIVECMRIVFLKKCGIEMWSMENDAQPTEAVLFMDVFLNPPCKHDEKVLRSLCGSNGLWNVHRCITVLQLPKTCTQFAIFKEKNRTCEGHTYLT